MDQKKQRVGLKLKTVFCFMTGREKPMKMASRLVMARHKTVRNCLQVSLSYLATILMVTGCWMTVM